MLAVAIVSLSLVSPNNVPKLFVLLAPLIFKLQSLSVALSKIAQPLLAQLTFTEAAFIK